MAGLVPAIQVFVSPPQDVDARHKPALGPAEGRTRVAGHDDNRMASRSGYSSLRASSGSMIGMPSRIG